MTIYTSILKLLLKTFLHILFWSLVFLFFTYFFGYGSSVNKLGFTLAIYLTPITIAITYLYIYHLIPEFFLKKRYIKFALYSIYTLIISSYTITISIFLGLNRLSKNNNTEMLIASKSIIFFLVGVYLVVFLVSAYKFMRLQIISVNEKNIIEQKMLAAELKLKEQELKYLKMQMHPHFLFNSLNTIYGFALKKAEQAPEMILKLSNLLDYILYKVDKSMVLLTDEILHIEDYIALEKLRFNDTLQVIFTKNNIPDSLQIPPMLLLPFVENSFKHGTIKNGKLRITINLKYDDGVLDFKIKNSHSKSNKKTSGIGLLNIKKRLDLLYKSTYNLDINQEDDKYEVTLNLKLYSNAR